MESLKNENDETNLFEEGYIRYVNKKRNYFNTKR